MTFEEYRDYLADEIEGTADWRSRKAEEFPDDPRNKEAAEGLAKLAEKIRSLPADDEKIRQLWRVDFSLAEIVSEDDKSLERAQAQGEFLREYGFSGTATVDSGEFLDDLFEAVSV